MTIVIVLSIIFLLTTELYIVLDILKKKINWKSYSIYFAIFLSSLLNIFNAKFTTDFVRFLFSTLILFFMTQIINKKKEEITNNFFAVAFTQLMFAVSEIIFFILLTIITKLSPENSVTIFNGAPITNSFITIIVLILYSTKFVKSKSLKFVSLSKNITSKMIITIILISIILINLLLASVYYKVNLIFLIIINTVFISFIIYIVYKLMDEKNKLLIQTNRTAQYKAENDALINNLHEYEKLADQHRMLNHENKNQLLAIKQMINNNEDGVITYIDKLLKTKVPDDQSLLASTKRIPSGGLQGIIYQKMLIIKKAKIKHSLNISRELKNLDFKKLDIDTNVDVCKIIGVFLDNAIEEVKGLKERMIGVDLYVEDDKLCISISNTYGKNKDFSKIDEVGYTTKSDGHGYGLSLVREILGKNERLENTRAVTGRFFTQIIKVSDMRHDDE